MLEARGTAQALPRGVEQQEETEVVGEVETLAAEVGGWTRHGRVGVVQINGLNLLVKGTKAAVYGPLTRKRTHKDILPTLSRASFHHPPQTLHQVIPSGPRCWAPGPWAAFAPSAVCGEVADANPPGIGARTHPREGHETTTTAATAD